MIRPVLVVIVVAACGSSPRPAPPAAAAPAPAPVEAPVQVEARAAFEPTSFAVAVSGHGRAVILIPGLGCPGSVWDETVVHFGGRVETHVLSLAGFAGRPPIQGPLSSTVRDELAHYIRDRKLDHPVVIGHSMGGFIAYWLAETEPDLVGSLIVVDAAPAMAGDVKPGAAKDITDGWRTATDTEFARGTREFFATMANDKVKLEPVIVAVARSDKRAFADAFDELFSTDIRSDLATIHVPTLIVLADDPGYLKLVTAQVEAIPHHLIVTMPDTKHFVFFDDPTGFFRAIDKLVLH